MSTHMYYSWKKRFMLLILLLCQFWLACQLIQAPFVQAASLPRIPSHSNDKSATAWSDFGFNSQNTRFNIAEKALSPLKVKHLKPAWKARTASELETSPITSNGILYISSADDAGHFYAFDTKSGKVRWSTTFGGPIYATPAIYNNVVYIGVHPTRDTGGSLFALNAKTGVRLWKKATSGNAEYSSPVVVNGIVYVSFDDGNLYAFNAKTGKIIWISQIQSSYSSAAVLNGTIYIGADDGALYALNAKTGKTLWSVPGIPGSISNSSAVVVNQVAYFSLFDLYTFHGYFEAYSTQSHQKLWNITLNFRALNSIAVANNIVYAGLENGTLYAMDTATGNKLWSFDTGGSIRSAPAVANGVVYIGSVDHKLYALNASTGEKLWSYATKKAISTSSPIVVDGLVYIGSEDDYLYAFSYYP